MNNNVNECYLQFLLSLVLIILAFTISSFYLYLLILTISSFSAANICHDIGNIHLQSLQQWITTHTRGEQFK